MTQQLKSPTRKPDIFTLSAGRGTYSVQVQCPAKINLTLKVLNKRADGFHNIESIMQTIDLFDILTINTESAKQTEIILAGNSSEIPYNETNLVHKAAKLFLEKADIENKKINIYIEKNIPVSAGLGGGSTDAAGTLLGLNEVFSKPLTTQEIHTLCAQLGSDLNVCLQGGRIFATGRGENLTQMEFENLNINIIKPKNLGISAKEAYTKFSEKIKLNQTSKNNYKNDLEWAVIQDYEELKHIKQKYPSSIMTGSGSAFYSTQTAFEQEAGFAVLNGHKAIPYGVKICN